MNRSLLLATVGGLLLAAPPVIGDSFVNWETPHVHPLELTPDGSRLLAVNTADNRLEVFDIHRGTADHLGSIPVGLDPVSVRARSSTEIWVVNHVSDSVSVVNLDTWNVVRTLPTKDEPADVVFAGTPQRAFVSCSQVNEVLVFDPADLDEAPIAIPIAGEDPRAMAVSPDRTKVYVAIFESGNRSTILAGAHPAGFFPPDAVGDPSGPYGGASPPPNRGAVFEPPVNPANPPAPHVGLIVRQDTLGRWMDDNGGDWTNLVSGADAGRSGRPVGWDLVDQDVAVLDASTLSVSYVRHLMNLCMALAVNPATGQISVVGTDATNEVRFEPNLNGRFLRVKLALVPAAQPDAAAIVDLNPHLTYVSPSVPPAVRALSLGDPRGLVWNAAGTRAYVTGMGSDNIVIVDSSGSRSAAPIDVGRGPTGIALDEPHGRLYALDRFDASISVIDTASETELARVPFFDPTPPQIQAGRRHLYDTHATSGLGHVACASCHPDARLDRLAWDLGNPAGDMIPFDQNCNFGSSVLGPAPCPDWHPMKGPMVTQTLQDIIGKEPHHWRGDRNGLEEFNQTFVNLQGADAMLTPAQMQALEDFLSTITLPPNPFRNRNNSLPAALPLPGHVFTGVGGAPGQPLPEGNAGFGSGIFRNHHLVQGFQVSCHQCHTLPTGIGTNLSFSSGSGEPLPPGPDGELHHAVVFSPRSETPSISIDIPQLRNLHEKVGFDLMSPTSLAGFGFMHDGSVDTLVRFLSEPFFNFGSGIDGSPASKVAGMVAFLLAFSGSDHPVNGGIPQSVSGPLSKDSHAAVGLQLTVDASNASAPATQAWLDEMMALDDAQQDTFAPGPEVALVAHGRRAGLARGFRYVGAGTFQSDRAAQVLTADGLRTSAGAGAELTFTVVPEGTEERVGTDRDEDGVYDRDELDACSDPADAARIPVPGAETVPSIQLGRTATGIALSWSEIGVSHDVIRGNLDVLRGTGGDFSVAVDACLADDLEAPSFSYGLPDGTGSSFFLVRSRCQGGGATYESGAAGQVGLRDAEIAAAPLACP